MPGRPPLTHGCHILLLLFPKLSAGTANAWGNSHGATARPAGELEERDLHGSVMHLATVPRDRILATLLPIALMAVCLGSLAAAMAPASAADDGNDPAHAGRVVFDIPAQPLVSALDAYSTLTGRELFYDGALVQGHRSAAVTGALTPDVALRILLRGTDFAWRATGPHSFTIAPARRAASLVPPPAAAHAAGDYGPFFAALQLGLRQAFCRSPETWPARYQLLIRFWIAPSGAVIRSELLGSTGSRERDRAFSAALQRLRLAAPLPGDMPQPVTMIVFPRSRQEAGECASSSIARGAN